MASSDVCCSFSTAGCRVGLVSRLVCQFTFNLEYVIVIRHLFVSSSHVSCPSSNQVTQSHVKLVKLQC